MDNFSCKIGTVLIPVKSVQSINLQLTFVSFEQFKQVVPIVFPNAKHITIECDDNDFKTLLKKRFGRKLNIVW